jgi:hypothetical protein
VLSKDWLGKESMPSATARELGKEFLHSIKVDDVCPPVSRAMWRSSLPSVLVRHPTKIFFAKCILAILPDVFSLPSVMHGKEVVCRV